MEVDDPFPALSGADLIHFLDFYPIDQTKG